MLLEAGGQSPRCPTCQPPAPGCHPCRPSIPAALPLLSTFSLRVCDPACRPGMHPLPPQGLGLLTQRSRAPRLTPFLFLLHVLLKDAPCQLGFRISGATQLIKGIPLLRLAAAAEVPGHHLLALQAQISACAECGPVCRRDVRPRAGMQLCSALQLGGAGAGRFGGGSFRPESLKVRPCSYSFLLCLAFYALAAFWHHL